MVHRKTQSSDYWSSFVLDASDLDFISNLLLESAEPKRAHELASAIIRHRVEAENNRLRRDLTGQSIYQPNKTFQIGESVAFPAMSFQKGIVTASRSGHNPDLGAFEVISVDMGNGNMREFAANYLGAHRLSDMDPSAFSDEASLQRPEQLTESHGEHVAIAANAALEKSADFIRIKDEWFLRAMMAEVNVGHLNLAEAVLDMSNGGPLTTDTLLSDLGLPPDIAGGVQEASLNAALARDERFDEISLNERPAWFLRRLEPAEVRQLPAALVSTQYAGGPVTLSEELLALAKELDDELEFDAASDIQPADSASIVLTFPHRRAGTLPWSAKTSTVLPKVSKKRLPMTFRDRVTNRDYTVWLVQKGRYIFGLADWFKQNEIPAGAYIELSRGPAENVVLLDYKRRRPRREWVRVATNRDGRLRLETAQRAASCEFDELMALFADDPKALDTLRGDQPRDVAQAVRESFPEIAKLSPQGNVHARTLYAAVNLITRAAPKEVFAALVAAGNYSPVGDNYWHLGD
ncbi:MAG: hypothetical protein HC853_14420 [Anaerolineae bacterium]|nr:hypothetical protein [Anaerolineae bacterium]